MVQTEDAKCDKNGHKINDRQFAKEMHIDVAEFDIKKCTCVKTGHRKGHNLKMGKQHPINRQANAKLDSKSAQTLIKPNWSTNAPNNQ